MWFWNEHIFYHVKNIALLYGNWIFEKAFIVIYTNVLLKISWMNIDCKKLSFLWWNNGKTIVFLLCLVQNRLQIRLNAFWIALEKSFSHKFWSKWIRCNAIGDTHSDLNAICRYGCTQWSFWVFIENAKHIWSCLELFCI